MNLNKVAVFRRAHFCAAHRLYNKNWDEETNNRIFGKCNNPQYHGHNYELEIKVTGVPDKDSGKNEVAPGHDLTVRVYETPRNYAEYPA